MRRGVFFILWIISSNAYALEKLKNEKLPSEASMQVGLNDIPHDILSIIFYHCNSKTLKRLGLLSKKWNKLNPRAFYPISFPSYSGGIKLRFWKARKRNHFEKITGLYNKGRFAGALNKFKPVSRAEVSSQIGIIGMLADLLAFNKFYLEAEYWYKIYYHEVPGDKVDDNRLIKSVIRNDFEHTNLLLKLGVNPDQRDEIYGSTALMFATQRGYSKLVRLLIQFNADIHAISKNINLSVFDFAMQEIHLDTIKTLIEAKIGIDMRHSKTGSTALMYGAQQNNKEVVQFLVDNGADRTLLNNWARTVFYFAGDNEEIWLILLS